MNAAANLAKAVPIYDDALQPLMRETGQALSTIGKAVNVALLPVRGMVWGAEKIEEWIATKVALKLENTLAEEIQTPDPSVAGPTIEALKFNGHKAELSEMFAGLFASAMKKQAADKTHPAFVDIIKSMTVLDARLFAEIADRKTLPTMHVAKEVQGLEGTGHVVGYINPLFLKVAADVGIEKEKSIAAVESSIENLARLGLILARSDIYLTAEQHKKFYDEMENGAIFKEFQKAFEEMPQSVLFRKSSVALSKFGEDFSVVVF